MVAFNRNTGERVEAILFLEALTRINSTGMFDYTYGVLWNPEHGYHILISTGDGISRVEDQYYIVQNNNGKRRAFSPEQFNKQFQVVTVIKDTQL